jgi:hypothetical protein
MLPMAVSVLACLIHAPPGAEVPAGKVSPDALEMARLEMPREVFDDLVASQMAQARSIILAQAVSKEQALRPGVAEELVVMIRDILSYDEIIPLVAQAYDRIYSPAEMQAICRFLRTPEGKKLALNRARVLREFQAEIQRHMNARKPELEKRLKAILGQPGVAPAGTNAPAQEGRAPAR